MILVTIFEFCPRDQPRPSSRFDRRTRRRRRRCCLCCRRRRCCLRRPSLPTVVVGGGYVSVVRTSRTVSSMGVGLPAEFTYTCTNVPTCHVRSRGRAGAGVCMWAQARGWSAHGGKRSGLAVSGNWKEPDLVCHDNRPRLDGERRVALSVRECVSA